MNSKLIFALTVRPFWISRALELRNLFICFQTLSEDRRVIIVCHHRSCRQYGGSRGRRFSPLCPRLRPPPSGSRGDRVLVRVDKVVQTRELKIGLGVDYTFGLTLGHAQRRLVYWKMRRIATISRVRRTRFRWRFHCATSKRFFYHLVFSVLIVMPRKIRLKLLYDIYVLLI